MHGELTDRTLPAADAFHVTAYTLIGSAALVNMVDRAGDRSLFWLDLPAADAQACADAVWQLEGWSGLAVDVFADVNGDTMTLRDRSGATVAAPCAGL